MFLQPFGYCNPGALIAKIYYSIKPRYRNIYYCQAFLNFSRLIVLKFLGAFQQRPLYHHARHNDFMLVKVLANRCDNTFTYYCAVGRSFIDWSIVLFVLVCVLVCYFRKHWGPNRTLEENDVYCNSALWRGGQRLLCLDQSELRWITGTDSNLEFLWETGWCMDVTYSAT